MIRERDPKDGTVRVTDEIDRNANKLEFTDRDEARSKLISAITEDSGEKLTNAKLNNPYDQAEKFREAIEEKI